MMKERERKKNDDAQDYVSVPFEDKSIRKKTDFDESFVDCYNFRLQFHDQI